MFFAACAERFVEAAQDAFRCLFRMKAPFEAGARQIVKLADAFQAEPPQEERGFGRKAQGFDGERRERFGQRAGGGDARGGLREAGQGVRGPQRFGETEPHAETRLGKAAFEVGQEAGFAAEEMGNAGDVEPEPGRAVHVERGTVAGRPAGESFQEVGIRARSGGSREKRRADGAGIGQPHAGRQPRLPSGRIDGGEGQPVCVAADKRERLLSRWRCMAGAHALPRQPLDRELRKPHGEQSARLCLRFGALAHDRPAHGSERPRVAGFLLALPRSALLEGLLLALPASGLLEGFLFALSRAALLEGLRRPGCVRGKGASRRCRGRLYRKGHGRFLPWRCASG